MSVEAYRVYDAAKRRFELDVQRARALQSVEEKQAAGVVDRLGPEMIAHLVGACKEHQLAIDDEARWTPRTRERKLQARTALRENAKHDLEEAKGLKALGDMETILDIWGWAAIEYAGLHGLNVDLETPGFMPYLQAFHDTQIEVWEAILRRTDGEAVPTPPAPPRRPQPERANRSNGRGTHQSLPRRQVGRMEPVEPDGRGASLSLAHGHDRGT
ncbi:MAG: hypothetical protein PGN16_09210 [Sphingomonas phyllosphaerae]|uniref:hypothetical protein n=1 Tax=Sphingomonas phyllosphaerae TaxID=257003 RepID=UPI002FF84BDE